MLKKLAKKTNNKLTYRVVNRGNAAVGLDVPTVTNSSIGSNNSSIGLGSLLKKVSVLMKVGMSYDTAFNSG